MQEMQRLTGYISHVAPERIVSQLTCSECCRLHHRLTESFLHSAPHPAQKGFRRATGSDSGWRKEHRFFLCVFVLQRDEQTAAYEESLTSDITHKPLQERTQPRCLEFILLERSVSISGRPLAASLPPSTAAQRQRCSAAV